MNPYIAILMKADNTLGKVFSAMGENEGEEFWTDDTFEENLVDRAPDGKFGRGNRHPSAGGMMDPSAISRDRNPPASAARAPSPAASPVAAVPKRKDRADVGINIASGPKKAFGEVPIDKTNRTENTINKKVITVWDASLFLEKLYRGHGNAPMDPTSKHDAPAINRMGDQMAKEALKALSMPELAGALGWYEAKVTEMWGTLTSFLPGLKDEKNRFVYTVALAITSDGNKLIPNMDLATEIYLRWMQTGELVGQGHRSGIATSLGRVNDILKQGRWQELQQWFNEKKTVAEWKAEGIDFTDKEVGTHKLYGAMALGPKIGSFFGNLTGKFETITMDMWWCRTIGRLRGKLTTRNMPRAIINVNDRLRPSLNDATIAKFGYNKQKLMTDDKYAIKYANKLATHNTSVFTGTSAGKLKELIKEKGQFSGPASVDISALSANGIKRYKNLKEWSQFENIPESTIINAAHWAGQQMDAVTTEEYKSSGRIYENVYGMYVAPKTPKDRELHRLIAQNAIEKVKLAMPQLKTITNADFQALMWYFEKKIWANLGVKVPGQKKEGDKNDDSIDDDEDDADGPEDYATAAKLTQAAFEAGKYDRYLPRPGSGQPAEGAGSVGRGRESVPQSGTVSGSPEASRAAIWKPWIPEPNPSKPKSAKPKKAAVAAEPPGVAASAPQFSAGDSWVQRLSMVDI